MWVWALRQPVLQEMATLGTSHLIVVFRNSILPVFFYANVLFQKLILHLISDFNVYFQRTF